MSDITSLCGWFTLLLLNILVKPTSSAYENVGCRVDEGVVPIDSPQFRYKTYYLKLRRCQGADTNPRYGRVCRPTSEKKFDVWVVKEDGSGFATLPETNHTACDFVCRDNASICNPYQTWNDDTCACDCPARRPACTRNKFWVQAQCNCFCSEAKRAECGSVSKEMDEATCDCIPKGRVSEPCRNVLEIKYVVIIMFVELFVVAAICALIFHRFFYTSTDEKSEEVRLNSINEKEEINA